MPRTRITVTPDNQNNPANNITEPPSYGKLVNSSEETTKEILDKLQPIADKNKAVLLAFIAPYFGKKYSPVDLLTAYIGFWEELGIEESVRNIKKKVDTKKMKLFLLVESPGGTVNSSYKIARYLRKEFSEIISFVPNVAASGGSLIAISANKIVMGEMANLTPIDVQTYYQGAMVSVNRYNSTLARLVEYFKTKRPEQVPYPYKALVDKLDPIMLDDWNSKTYAMMKYVNELLILAGYQNPKIEKIINNFILTIHPHDFIIHKEEANDYGLEISTEFDDELNCMRWWLNNYMLSSGTEHYIRYIFPKTK